MNINMIDVSEKSGIIQDKTEYSSPSKDNARIADSMVGYSLDITGKVMENAAYGKDELKSAEAVSEEAGMIDVTKQRNYMAVMSNSMSEEDFSELIKDGYNPTHTNIEESVTSLDRLKAKMAETGQVIEGFNDDLSSEDVKEALNIAGAIMPLTDENKIYMLQNEQEPTIENLYKAEYSSRENTYSDYGLELEKPDIAWDEIKPQAEKIITESGYPVTDETTETAKWLIKNQLPLNEDNIKASIELDSLTLPASEETVLSAINTALLEGKSAKEANLAETDNLYKQAADIKAEFESLSDNNDITRRRRLEEIRLAMTTEANLTLLRKGISVDTQDLENLVETLKKAEEDFYRPLLDNGSPAEGGYDEKSDDEGITQSLSLREKIDLFKETQNTLPDIKELPVKAVGDIIKSRDDLTLSNIEKTGNILKSEYEKAEKSYETMMTAPRPDMGDSISKAFRNVDDILEDLDMPLSEENRKAVRIMGYSQIQISREAVNEVRTASNTVQSVIDMMTPAKTLQMIREGHNPLAENLYELEAELKKESNDESTEKYSRFLVKLENRGEITEDERSAFIGMYRLFDKIEKNDSRVIGKVLDQGEELNFKNLLTAYRSGKTAHLDVNVDDEFGALNDLIEKGESITDQIERGFAEISEEDIPKEYIKDKLSMIEEAAGETEAENLLRELEIPVNVENILAASDFTKRSAQPFGKLTKKEDGGEKENTAKEEIAEAAKKAAEDFSDGGDREAYESFIDEALKVSENMVLDSDTYIDVREWAKLNRQIEIAGNMARFDEYEVPVETDDGYINVRLKIKDTGKGEGKVEASYTDENYGEIKAAFSVDGSKVSGIISAGNENGFDYLKKKEKKLIQSLNESGFETENIIYVKANSLNDRSLNTGNSSNRNLFRVAGQFLKAMEKEQ